MDIYTDGSSLGNNSKQNLFTPGGWGFVVVSNEKEIFSDSRGCLKATNNEMELQAMIEALQYVKNNTVTTCTIHTDSNYVNQGLNIWSKKWEKNGFKTSTGFPVKNQDRWKKIIDLKKILPQVVVQWVKAHDTNVWNNKADILARTSAEAMKPT